MSSINCCTTDSQIQTVIHFDCLSVNADLVGSEAYRNFNGEVRFCKKSSCYDVRLPRLLKKFGVSSRSHEGLMLPNNHDHQAKWERYEYNLLLNIPGYHSRVIFQFKPRSGKTSYCRWSWVPSHWDEAGLQKLAAWHHRIFAQDYERFFEIGTVSRSDLAIDFPGLDCNRLALYVTHVHSDKSKVYINTLTNQRETFEIGKDNSLYNKTEQLVATKQPNLYPGFDNVPRYERKQRFSRKKNVTVASLPNLVFPLERVQLYFFPLDRLPTTHALRFQVELILRHGLQRVLWHKDPKAAQHLLDQIAHYRIYPIDIGAAHCEFANQVCLKLTPFGVQLQPFHNVNFEDEDRDWSLGLQ